MNKLLLSFALAAAAFFVACDDSITSSGVSTVAAKKDLGKCSSSNEGEITYVKDSAATYLCSDNEWRKMALTTTSSEDGRDGVNGVNGLNGADGASCEVKSLKDESGYKILCGGDSVGVLLNGKTGATGKQGATGPQGKEGATGKTGAKGDKGDAGQSCTVKEITNGYKVLCGGDSVGVLLNGKEGVGTVGQTGKSAYEIAQEHGFKGDEKAWLESLKGKGCSAKAVEGGVEITCGDEESVLLKNGENGRNCTVEEGTGVVLLKCGDDEVTLRNSEPRLGICGNRVYDMDNYLCDTRDEGTLYRIVTIASDNGNYSETWMAENLRYDPDVEEGSNCNSDDCLTYGRYYSWKVAANEIDGQGICPEGWRLPQKEEWEALLEAVGGKDIAGKMLKASLNLWESYKDDDEVEHDGMGVDRFGFSVLPAGMFNISEEKFEYVGTGSVFWSANESSIGLAWGVSMSNDEDKVYVEAFYEYGGASVRCVKNPQVVDLGENIEE